MKILLFANTDWFLYNFRLPLALAFRQRGCEVVLLSPPGEFAPRLEALGFRWIAFPLERAGMNPLTEAAAVARLARIYRRERPDLVHQSTGKCVLYGSLAARLARIGAVVNSITGLGYLFTGEGRSFRALRAFLKLGYRFSLRGTQAIFENPHDRQFFVDEGLVDPADAHVILGAGVDPDEFAPTPEPQGAPVVTLPARMLRDKGVTEFVEAARRLKAAGVQARFVLTGNMHDGNPTAIPAAQLQAWQAEGVIEWQGWREKMPAVFAESNLVCLPSYREGLPRTLLEAAASGRAVVTTDIPGCRDVVTDGENGLLVPPRDADALARAIARLLGDPQLRAAMGAAGRRRVLKEFSTAHVIRQTLAVCRRAGLKGLQE